MTVLISSLVFRTFLFLFLLAWITKGHKLYRQTARLGRPMVFNVMRYGAIEGGRTDNSQAFLKAWIEACKWDGRAKVVIPPGTFKLFPVIFSGPCKGNMAFVIKGTLLASTSPSALSSENWISFRNIEQLTVAGGGTLDGQGSSVWSLNDCKTNPVCKALPTSMTFDFVTNASVHHLRSFNSQNGHFKVHGCQKIDFGNIRISAPEDSPNTDGIKIGNSYRIRIRRTIIETGDDCIGIVSGSQKIHISNVFCGPGHGISIGSLGGHSYTEYDVEGIFVKNSVFKKTDNGLRIKTWARDSPKPLKASNIVYEDINMIDVRNPIVIDQQYCPNNQCNQQATSSNVQISDVTFRNIWGTSSSQEAVTLKCSKSKPCKNIVMENIKLPHTDSKGAATTSICNNVIGNSYGSHIPPSCI
ncbi:putative glycosidase [Rosa chinensis]|uniref:Putative glycosidase n=2 Tax=Rosa chinensis TaxID=74649 RepID=A0A2P6Q2L5_ROSCH|nr:putative glycosidase [Rosa chinensis]